jgi:quercetin dioxygenase-like cupin family protein
VEIIMEKALVVRGTEGEVFGSANWLFKASGAQTDGQFDFMVGPVGYLSGPPLHTHTEQYDTFYVLDGVLTVQAGEDLFELRAGDFVTVPPGVPHTFDSVHEDQPVTAINVMTPGGLGEVFAAHARPVLDDEERDRLRRRYGVTVGPPLREKLGLG